MNPKTLKHPLLERYKMSSAVTEIAFDKLERSQAQQTFNTACETEAEAIKSIAAEGSLAVKVALEYHLQLRDLRKFAKTPADEAKIKQGLKDLEAGLSAYADLMERPREYKNQAAGYTDRNKDTRRDIPKDGMRYAIASQMTRLQNRQSLQLSDEEKVLLSARRMLLQSIQEDYSLLQQKVVHESES